MIQIRLVGILLMLSNLFALNDNISQVASAENNPLAGVDPNNVYTIKDQDRNLQVNTKPNSVFVITMPGNPTTGYGWFFKNADENNRTIQPLNLNEYGSGEYVGDKVREGYTGAGGTYYFKFRANQPTNNTTANLHFTYERPWLPNEPLKSVKVFVKIN